MLCMTIHAAAKSDHGFDSSKHKHFTGSFTTCNIVLMSWAQYSIGKWIFYSACSVSYKKNQCTPILEGKFWPKNCGLYMPKYGFLFERKVMLIHETLLKCI
jgi:hypothetical protein